MSGFGKKQRERKKETKTRLTAGGIARLSYLAFDQYFPDSEINKLPHVRTPSVARAGLTARVCNVYTCMLCVYARTCARALVPTCVCVQRCTLATAAATRRQHTTLLCYALVVKLFSFRDTLVAHARTVTFPPFSCFELFRLPCFLRETCVLFG